MSDTQAPRLAKLFCHEYVCTCEKIKKFLHNVFGSSKLAVIRQVKARVEKRIRPLKFVAR